MARNAVTQRYLEQVERHGLAADALQVAARRTRDLMPTCYRGKCLSRPAFLSHAEQQTLELDLGHLHAAAASIPDRMFGGDLAAFARSAGMTEPQVAAVLRGPGEPPSRIARGDIYHDGTEFRVMELNLGSTIGGFDHALLASCFLNEPFFADFVAANNLTYRDTMAKVADLLRAEGEAAGV